MEDEGKALGFITGCWAINWSSVNYPRVCWGFLGMLLGNVGATPQLLKGFCRLDHLL